MNTFRASAWLLLCLLNAGCAHWQLNELAAQLPQTGAAETLARLEALRVPDRDQVQWLLNRGMLRFHTGDLAGSREDLEQAKQRMAKLQAASLTENLAAATANETLRQFAGSPSEQVMLHGVLALAYLADGQLDGARTEILQADLLMRALAEKDPWLGQLATLRFLGGVVFELSNEPDNAMISYRKALVLLDHRNEPVPAALADRLVALSNSLGLDAENRQLRQRFPTAGETGSGMPVILLYLDGLISSRQQNRLAVFSPDASQLVTIALPGYPPVRYRPRPLSLTAGATALRTEPVELLDTRVREDLDATLPRLTALAVTRVAARYSAVRNAQNQNEHLAAALLNILGAASEQADTRSWNMLPASLQVAFARVPTGRIAALATAPPPFTLASGAQALQTDRQWRTGSDALVIIASAIGQQYFPVVFP